MPPIDTEQARWFAKEVLPHEPALRGYLHSRFPSLGDQDDIVQETYARLLRVYLKTGVRSVRAYLFTTARNAALDFFRRQRTNPSEPITDFGESCVLEHATNASDACDQHEELEILAEAVGELPPRCREVVLLRYLDGLAYKEIAARLGISPETVKVQLAKGMRRCAEFFQKHGLMEPPEPRQP